MFVMCPCSPCLRFFDYFGGTYCIKLLAAPSLELTTLPSAGCIVNCNKLQDIILYLTPFYYLLSCFSCCIVESEAKQFCITVWKLPAQQWWRRGTRFAVSNKCLDSNLSVVACPDQSPPPAYYHSYVVPLPSTTITKLTHSHRQHIPADPLVFTIWQEWFRNCGGPVVLRPFPAAVTC